MSALTGEWECALHEEFSKEYYKNLFFFIRKQYSETIVYPCEAQGRHDKTQHCK